jgi:hypothetical protein
VLSLHNSVIHTVRVCYILEGQLQTLFFDGFNANSENVGCSDPALEDFHIFYQIGILVFSQVDLIGFISLVLPALFYFVAGGGFALFRY